MPLGFPVNASHGQSELKPQKQAGRKVDDAEPVGVLPSGFHAKMGCKWRSKRFSVTFLPTIS